MKRSLDRATPGVLRGAADAALQLVLPLFGGAAPVAPGAAPVPVQRRHALLGRQVIEYEFRRSRRRSIGFVIDGGGLRVTAPRHTPLAEVDAALTEKSDWVLRKMQEWREHVARREQSAIRWSFDESVPYLGGQLRLEPAPAPGGRAVRRATVVEVVGVVGVVAVHRDMGAAVGSIGTGHVGGNDAALKIWLPPHAPAEALRDAAQDWLKSRARELFTERMAPLTTRLGRAPSRWSLSSARTRWGSCAPDGSIRLNWRLVHFPLPIIDYVIAHELAHLVHMNHGPRFWAKVESLIPDYREARQLLRNYPDDMMTN